MHACDHRKRVVTPTGPGACMSGSLAMSVVLFLSKVPVNIMFPVCVCIVGTSLVYS